LNAKTEPLRGRREKGEIALERSKEAEESHKNENRGSALQDMRKKHCTRAEKKGCQKLAAT